MVMTCNTGGLWQQGRMDVAVDLYLAIPLLFTILALILASVFVKLQGAEGQRPQEPTLAKAARESVPRDQMAAGVGLEAGREWLPVEEGGAVKERKEAAAKQWEKAAEKPSPAAAQSISRQPPAEPCEPEPQEDVETKIPPLGSSAGSSLRHPGQVEDVGDHAAFPSKAEEEDLDSKKEKLVVREPASTAATPAPVTSTAESFESSEGFEWPLGTLGTCLQIVMGISMLAHIQTVFYP
ncbi:LOW QUALITY PROTEIN: uncharacterized protein LOC133207226 [Neopsephotus bourkii]|uniref:LOW QUALITY PROTEIN: uncharacterized protein LOC133207226 n=1 Tax=Neopsephotus bourkii TaxID=309878 RepID=UPI002AA562C7|nr:LOW QUALITY PROTEIN: uncharacterized protein LOC133207226 [Neopsephotus bourkii]